MKKRSLKKVMTGMLTGALVISGFGIGGFAQKAKADSTELNLNGKFTFIDSGYSTCYSRRIEKI